MDTKPPALRTTSQVLGDPEIGTGYVIVEDSHRGEYEATGYILAEDLAGSMCLMKRPTT